MEFFINLSPVMQALLATIFTWFVTAVGSSMVIFFKTVNKTLLDLMLGFAAGVMIAASFWSLLNPAIEMSNGSWVPAVVGFLVGGAFLRGADLIIPHLHKVGSYEDKEGVTSKLPRSTLMVFAITLHNFPEGLAVGVAFGAAGLGLHSATLTGAIALAIGIGIQNFPEGAAVSIPLRIEGISRWRSFMWGQFSGMVEPIAGVIGATIVLTSQAILPYALSFAAGAMIYVVAEEVIPEAHSSGKSDIATIGVIIGFALMMALDVALG